LQSFTSALEMNASKMKPSALTGNRLSMKRTRRASDRGLHR
jgi:hypothetical protein